MNMTDWFAFSVKPFRAGWYETKTNDIAVGSRVYWWDNHQWKYHPDRGPCLYQNRAWRGLAEKQE